ncbi:gas vesicle protein [Streptomyces tateyamensis]|uniref:Gas vesicle protein n=1 Tax=Streptomyces tateyamensis TaxID=565073 RepID=A0A2V4NPQ4_9ACTN|nr:GvpL/GvpF family gas vesicle protein [Streptomyces tateyamensis]PYC87598.1 gas vesicle protein [Streptomyces tateyamensis]
MTDTDSPAPDGSACYVYGVVPAEAHAPRGVEGVGDPPSPVALVRHRQVAAVVSEIDLGRPLGTPGDLLAHSRVLDSLAAHRTAVLPFRFGALVRDRESVTAELLAPQQERFLAGLGDLAGHAQFSVRGSYRQDRVLRAIVDERPDIARLRDQVAALPEDAARLQRIQLGELVSQELTTLGAQDAELLMRTLAPLAARASSADATADRPVNASFLVPHSGWQEFERAAEELAADWDGWLELRLLGPLAPYDFASQVVDVQEGGPPWD